MMVLRLLVALTALGAPAVLPLLLLVGRRPLTVLLILPAGGLLAALAAIAAVASASSMTVWLVVVDVAANAAAAIVLARRMSSDRRWIRADTDAPAAIGAALVVVVAALVRLVHPALDWDARSIWLLHARLLRAGGGAYVSALHNPAYLFSHLDYPPLAPASVVTGWKVSGPSSYRLAQVVLAAQTASMLLVAAVLLARAVHDRRRRWLAPALAGIFMLAALGSAGAYFTNGYADVLVAAAATAGALALLVDAPSPQMATVGLVCCLVAALTKDEGLVAALLVLLLWAVRMAVAPALRRWLASAFVVTTAVMLLWPAVIAGRGGPHGSILSSGTVAAGPSTGHVSRLTHAVAALAGHLPVLPPVAAASVLAVLVARRREPQLTSVLTRLWALVGLDVGVLLVTYTFGRLPIHYWLRTSAERVALFPALLLYAVAAVVLAKLTDPSRPREMAERS